MWFTNVPNPNPFIEKHAHPYDDMLLFLGTNPQDLTDLGAEIELYLGEEEKQRASADSRMYYTQLLSLPS
jgi:hypothetical protein